MNSPVRTSRFACLLLAAGCCACGQALAGLPSAPRAGGSASSSSTAQSGQASLRAAFDILAPKSIEVPRQGKPGTVDLTLRLTNTGRQEFVVGQHGTVAVYLADSKGVAPIFTAKPASPPTGPSHSRPIAPGGRHDFVRPATLSAAPDGKLRLSGSDGAGGSWSIDGLKPGRYRLWMAYDSAASGKPPVAGQLAGRHLAVPVDIDVR